jgi:uncharacterized protein YjhX (UPF0386 family)
MNIPKTEQRVLHALAQGGAIHFERLPNGKVHAVRCFTRECHVLAGCDVPLSERLRKRRFLRSRRGGPYRMTRAGPEAVRAQFDSRRGRKSQGRGQFLAPDAR